MINPDRPLFLDTSALIAFFDKKDQYHLQAINFLKTTTGVLKGTTSNLVLSEFLTYFSRYGFLAEAIEFHDNILQNPEVNVVWIDPSLHQSACETLKKFADKKLSFTDAAGLVVMKQEHLTHAFSFDDDFVKAGFAIVP